MPNRGFSSLNYRYGFNGKEEDNEVKGEGNQQDYGMRIYDPRLSKFLSVDPLTKQYPHYTPYSFAGNKPTTFIDRDGEEEGLDFAMQRDDRALLEGKITTEQYRENQVARAMGGILGAAIICDAFFTKGRLTQFLITSQFLGTLHHNRAASPKQEAERQREFNAASIDMLFGWGIGKLTSLGFKASAEILSIARNRFNIARNFYKEAGYSEDQFLKHAGGIDLGEEVKKVTYEKGQTVIQWRRLDKVSGEYKPGDYYTLPDADPTKLGIDLTDRKPFKVILNERTEFLKSTATDIEDTWSKPGTTINVKGGEKQLFQTKVKGTAIKQ